tara:strand:+ start:159 stop:782 length:624 start_codon:yes stop_codon:yes gene_type:complete
MIDINRTPIFTQEVFHFTLPNFEEWKKHINQIVLVEENKNIHKHDTSPEKACSVMAKRTAWNSHLRYQSLDNLCKEIASHLEKFIEKEGYDIPKLVVTDCWINWYKKNQYAQPHRHGHCLSVVFFVDVEKSNGKFFFNSDNYAVLTKKSETHTNYNNTVQVDVKDGTILFFDGSISHSVSSNTSDNNRITVAINFDVNYLENRDEYK